MASDEAAAAVRGGTLTDALDEPGFGGFSLESARGVDAPDRWNRESAVRKRRRKLTSAPTGRQKKQRHAAAQDRIKAAAADVKHAETALAAVTKRRDDSRVTVTDWRRSWRRSMTSSRPRDRMSTISRTS